MTTGLIHCATPPSAPSKLLDPPLVNGVTFLGMLCCVPKLNRNPPTCID